MEGYKLRQSVIFGDSRAAELKVFANLDLYATLMTESELRFLKDEWIAEICLFFCWDNESHMVTEACLLGIWERTINV